MVNFITCGSSRVKYSTQWILEIFIVTWVLTCQNIKSPNQCVMYYFLDFTSMVELKPFDCRNVNYRFVKIIFIADNKCELDLSTLRSSKLELKTVAQNFKKKKKLRSFENTNVLITLVNPKLIQVDFSNWLVRLTRLLIFYSVKSSISISSINLSVLFEISQLSAQSVLMHYTENMFIACSTKFTTT